MDISYFFFANKIKELNHSGVPPRMRVFVLWKGVVGLPED